MGAALFCEHSEPVAASTNPNKFTCSICSEPVEKKLMRSHIACHVLLDGSDHTSTCGLCGGAFGMDGIRCCTAIIKSQSSGTWKVTVHCLKVGEYMFGTKDAVKPTRTNPSTNIVVPCVVCSEATRSETGYENHLFWRDSLAKHYAERHPNVQLPTVVVIQTLTRKHEIPFSSGNGYRNSASHDEKEALKKFATGHKIEKSA